MSANHNVRILVYLLHTYLLVAVLGGSALLGHSSLTALAGSPDDGFDLPAVLADAYITAVTTAPTADFSGDPTTGMPPLDVQFTDQSTGGPSGWAWYFGDEYHTGPWIQMTLDWPSRTSHTSVALPDGSIVLMGGTYYTGASFARLNDVWRSTDQGASWTQMTASAEWLPRVGHTSVALPDGSIVLMGGYGGSPSACLRDVWRSTDQGATWTQMTASAEWSERSGHSSVALPDGSIVLMGGGVLNDVWRTTDQGATWTQVIEHAEWTPRYNQPSVALPDGNIVLMGSDVWRSTDQGATWTQMTTAAPISSCPGVALPDGSIVLVGGGVWRTTDQGASWSQLAARAQWTARSEHTSVAMPDGSIVLMGGNRYIPSASLNDVWRSTDQGTTWTQMTAAAPWVGRTEHTSVALPDGSIVLIGGQDIDNNGLNDVWRSTDQGATWTQMTAAAEWTPRYGHTSVALPDGSIVLMGGGSSHSVWRSTDQGATWTQMTAAAEWSGRMGHTSVALPDGSIVLMGGYDGSITRRNDVWRSTDQGATWTQLTAAAPWVGRMDHTSEALPDSSIVLIGGTYYDGGFIYLNDVWRSMDQGASWKQTTAAAEWTPRYDHASVTLPDSSIVLMGGMDRGGGEDWNNGVFRLETADSTEQHPAYTYNNPGIYSVALQVYNASGYSNLRKEAYINTTGTVTHFIYLPLVLRNTP